MNKTTIILKEMDGVLAQVDQQNLSEIAKLLKRSNRIFVIGEGRSGLMAKSFAMRLMHLGASVFVVGETITPSIGAGDTLVAVSGSGTTKSVVWTAEKAKSINCEVVGISTKKESGLGLSSSHLVHIPAATKFRREGETETIQPLGSLFDQCAHIVFDTICLLYADLNHVDNSQAFKQHSNLE
ncbi:6-phospho-3-hexuloisomerase [Peribacillus sp. B-H-3]|uniref:6-phospho-3-hexuloisomerase n=1 Tax=Peribacillus sp. B-H-3 TaxID=3400420 RepID=UPI003B02B4CF